MMATSPRAQLDLNGTWQLAFDADGRGIERGWTRGSFPHDAAPEQVPAIWEINHPDVQGVGFYQRTFRVPSEWTERVIHLHFGGASYHTTVWLNGAYLGAHEGAYTPFEFDVTAHIRRDADNELIVRVAGLSRTHAIDGRVLQHVPASKQSWYYVYSGLWGSVSLQARASLALDSVWVEPNLGQEWARVQVAIENHTEHLQTVQLVVEILDHDGRVQAERSNEFTFAPGKTQPEFRTPLPHARAWSVETPNLYTARVSIERAGQTVDTVETRFGMRDFTVNHGEFMLNGEPILMRGVLLQPNYPVNLIVPPDAEMMRREIMLVKAAGFNLMRAHLRPAPPGFLDLADELGILVYAESSIAWIRDNPRLPEHCRRELTALIERDRNHPSVVIWGIHNENRVGNALTGESLVRLARSLDPTRVILDHSGGSLTIDQDFGWIDRTTVVPNRETERQKMQDVHAYVGSPIPDGVYEWLRTIGTTPLKVDLSAYNFGAPALFQEWERELRGYEGKVFVSELGCGGMADLVQVVAGFGAQTQLVDAREMIAFRDDLKKGFHERKLERVFGTVENLVRAAQAMHATGTLRQVEALLCNPRVSGYSITQWNDVAWEFHAGLVDHWRNPKAAYYAAQKLHEPHHLVLKAERAVAAPGTKVDVACTLVNQSPLGEDAKIEFTLFTPDGQEILNESRVARCRGINECGSIRLALGERSGIYRLWARLMRGNKVITESTERILSLPPTPSQDIAAHVEWVGARPPAFEMDTAQPASDRVLFAAQPSTLISSDWATLFEAITNGRTAIIGALQPKDETALRAFADHSIGVELHYGIGNWMPCYHWIPPSSLFEGLPAGDLAGEVYADVLPWYVPLELGGEVLAGSFRNTQSRLESPRMLWYGDIEGLSIGKGKLILCQYRLADRVANPLAAKLLCNLINYARL